MSRSYQIFPMHALVLGSVHCCNCLISEGFKYIVVIASKKNPSFGINKKVKYQLVLQFHLNMEVNVFACKFSLHGNLLFQKRISRKPFDFCGRIKITMLDLPSIRLIAKHKAHICGGTLCVMYSNLTLMQFQNQLEVEFRFHQSQLNLPESELSSTHLLTSQNARNKNLSSLPKFSWPYQSFLKN